MFVLLLAVLAAQPADQGPPPDKGPDNKTEASPPSDTQPAWTIPASMKLIQDGCSGPIELTGLYWDGSNINNGSATLVCSPNSEPMRGRAMGSFYSSTLRLQIDWGCVKQPWPQPCKEIAGLYTGVVQPDGRLVGVTHDVRNPSSQANWRSAEALPQK
jgi:hypothetical protein